MTSLLVGTVPADARGYLYGRVVHRKRGYIKELEEPDLCNAARITPVSMVDFSVY